MIVIHVTRTLARLTNKFVCQITSQVYTNVRRPIMLSSKYGCNWSLRTLRAQYVRRKLVATCIPNLFVLKFANSLWTADEQLQSCLP